MGGPVEDLEERIKEEVEDIEEQVTPENILAFATTGQTVPGEVAGEGRPALRELGEAVGADIPTPGEIEERKKRGAEAAAGQRAIATKKKKEDERRRRGSALQSRLKTARQRALGSETILG